VTKIAHVAVLAVRHPGVEHKIRSQAAALDELGVENFDIYVINTERNGADGRIRYLQVDRRWAGDGLALAFRRFQLIKRTVPCERYDLLYLRYPLADLAGPAFAREYPTVTEHNAMEVRELVASAHSPELAPPLRAYRLANAPIEAVIGPRVLRRCRGLVAVTDEIRGYELGRLVTTVPSLTVANGIDVDRVTHTRFAPFRGDCLRIVFIGGRNSPWHGLDRLLCSLSWYKGSVTVECNLVGDLVLPRVLPTLPDTVRIHTHGVLTGCQLDALMEQMNLGIGTLALYRKGLTEACTLKVREYTARGLPFVLAHKDHDLHDVPEATRFFLPVGNDEAPIDMDRVLSFAERVSRLELEETLSSEMRSHARAHMDWTEKVRSLLVFLTAVTAQEK
jgi:hypothetical protein